MQERKVCLITGGGKALLKDGKPGAIGYGIAHVFAAEGYNLVITGRNVKKLESAKEELESLYGIEVLPLQGDVAAGNDNEETVRAVIESAISRFGRLYVLINNARLRLRAFH
ncbi:SDR family NAD(P)-dependent oxidoreductase [Faecalibaculum rodentium]|uniref:SDR family NAD(P)-dependent oxidoreductase n=1 Tax=Faecalibaculum rodentium TaxID=1702221 RepID=UPI00256EA441|nr:SDR family NAD(P)-dependent oxidoreductase [Faecalibaculum rodentium]